MIIKTNFVRLAGLSLFSLLIACNAEDQAGTKAHLKASRPAWVPENSTLMYGVDGSVWANCAWEQELYHCSFYEVSRDARIEQSYELCTVKTSAVLLDRPSDNSLSQYDTNGVVLVPVTAIKYYMGDQLDQRRSKLAQEEYQSLEINECVQKFIPVEENE